MTEVPIKIRFSKSLNNLLPSRLIVVKPDKVDDLASHKIARDIKTKIEEELTYPGHIKVTVIREIRASEIAK